LISADLNTHRDSNLIVRKIMRGSEDFIETDFIDQLYPRADFDLLAKDDFDGSGESSRRRITCTRTTQPD